MKARRKDRTGGESRTVDERPVGREEPVVRTRVVSWILIGILTSISGGATGLAQEQKDEAAEAPPAQAEVTQGEAQQEGGGDLAQQARNPTASLTMFQILVNYTSGFHNLEGADMTSVTLMPVIPFKTGKLSHIARVTLPWVASSPDWALLQDSGPDVPRVPGISLPPDYVPTADVNGLGDTAVFDLMLFNAPWKGKIAAGVSAMVPTATDPVLGTEKWSLGPAVGGVVQAGKLLAGAIVLTNFSVAGKSDRDDVRLLSFQPFASYGLSGGWSIETPNMMFKWTALPLGARIGKLATFGKQPVRFFAEAEYNFVDTGVGSRWTFRFAVVPLL